MKRYRHHDSERLQQEISYFASKGYSNRQIAALLDRAETEISTVRNLAVNNKWLEPAPRFLETRVPPERLEELKVLDFPHRLKQPLHDLAMRSGVERSRLLNAIEVFHTGSQADSPDGWDARLARFARLAAPALLAILIRANVTGVTWGHTIATVIRALTGLDATALHRAPKTFFATCGEPFGSAASEISSSSIVQVLDDLQGRKTSLALTLRGVPALIPSRFNKAAILEFVSEHTAFGKIFGDGLTPRSACLIGHMDTLITSVGTFDQTAGMYTSELEDKWKIHKDTLKSIAHGDLGGALIARDEDGPLQAEKASRFAEISGMFTGITVADIEALANRIAVSDGQGRRPGIVVLAIGENKARIVYEVIRRGLVTELIIDHDLAFELGRLCKIDMVTELPRSG